MVRATIVSVICAGWCGAVALSAQKPPIPAPSAAFLVRSLSSGAVLSQARPDILDTPLLPGSIAKAATLVAALETGVITPATARLCRRVVTVDGRTYTCTHPDLKRPLSPAEALAHSCNDFFVSLAPWLSREALAVYFPGASTGPVPAAPAADDDDVQLALPGAEQNERAALVALLRRSRDDVAAAAGVPAPAVLRVTVHPTVESFGRATGQAWHVAGATGPRGIDLLPLTVLRRNGQLERVVRHEVAHAVVDQFLQNRPLWVREGAAAYFAAPQESGEAPATACPADAELHRPATPTAQQQAYARAEMCFRRALARGVSWRDVQ